MSLLRIRQSIISSLMRYGAAVLSSALALAIVLAFDDLSVEPNTLMPYIGAVMFSSWYGGLGPGLLAALLTGVSCVHFSLAPAYSIAIKDATSAARLAEFLSVALLICLLNASRRAAQQRAEIARTAAETANSTKDHFLAMISHELRTPINSILGWAPLIRAGKISDAESVHGLEVIERNARVQAQMIEELLDVTRIVTGKLQIQTRQVDLKVVVESAVDMLRPAAQGKGVQLQVSFGSLDGYVRGDPDRLQQVVWNLLSNAIKFTPREGQVTVQLDRVDHQFQITVRDTGAGVNPEFLPHVFERFSQAEPAAGPSQGLGLGLAIVQHVVGLHGGTVRAESPGLGGGSIFIVMLPAWAAPKRLEPRMQVQYEGRIEPPRAANTYPPSC